MTVYEKIIKAMEFTGWPHAPELYTGPAEKYFYYNYAADSGLVFGDDGCDLAVAGVQIHVCLPIDENYIQLKKRIRDELVKQGFTFPTMTPLLDESINQRRLVFECEIEEEE